MIERPAPGTNLVSQKMGIHDWSYDNAVSSDDRGRTTGELTSALQIETGSRTGSDVAQAFDEAQRCLNCDVQTVF
ncbi:MAG: hypothetical protein R3E73_06960 [Porticoccaceae bacterium]